MWRCALITAALCIAALPAFAGPVLLQTYGAAVQVSNGGAVPSVAQLEIVLRPGDFVRDILGWQKADPHCDLQHTSSPKITIPSETAVLYKNVAAAQGRNFVTLAFNNVHCGQPTNSGSGTFPTTPALRAEFAAYAVGVVNQVPALGGISIWNELNGTWNGHLGSEAQTLTQYCLLANAVIIAVRQVDKKIPITIGASQGWNIDGWFNDMFDKYGCIGKGDPTIWLDVHPYLSGAKARHTHKTDWQLWQQKISNIREDGITNPLMATEWGAQAAYQWLIKHPKGDYPGTFKSQVLEQDPNWAGATWFEMLYDKRFPNAGLFDSNSSLTEPGANYINDFRDN